ncbi:hypothetical protein C8R47DRAFT_1269881 [Mycena vitilis]|nr:hypothetical protein C8R47DRAFT_1269881 [Mycena vitilis]
MPPRTTQEDITGPSDGAPASLRPEIPDLPDKGDAVWLEPDEKVLLEYLGEHVSEGNENKAFKPVTFRRAAAEVNKIRTKGGPKTYKSCQQKYASLRKLQKLVEIILGVSGWKWDFKKGCDIDEATQGSWDAWVANNKEGKRFRNKGWPHYDLLLPLAAETAKGTHAFRGTTAPRPPSPDWDLDAMDRDHDAEGEEGQDGGAGRNNEDEDEDDLPNSGTGFSSPAPPPAGSLKRAAATPHLPGFRKKARLSTGAQGLVELAAASQDFNDIFGSIRDILASTSGPTTTPDTAVAPTASTSAAAVTAVAATSVPTVGNFQTSPQRRNDAVALAQNELWLTPLERLELIEVLDNIRLADVYTGLRTEELRIQWIIRQLNKVGVTVFHPEYSFNNFTF